MPSPSDEQRPPRKKFVFIGGAPVFDYLIDLNQGEIQKGTGGRAMFVDTKVYLPAGTIFRCRTDQGREIGLNPMANSVLEEMGGRPYYALEFGGKQSQTSTLPLTGEVEDLKKLIAESYAETVSGPDQVPVVEVSAPVQVSLGGNNRNIIAAIRGIYYSEELLEKTRDIEFFHFLFADTNHPLFGTIVHEYAKYGVDFGRTEEIHIDGLIPREGYVISLSMADGQTRDRTILSNRTNEEVIPEDRLMRRYFELERSLRSGSGHQEIHLVLNTVTNPEEMRLALRLVYAAHAARHPSFFCLSGTFLKCAQTLVDKRLETGDPDPFPDHRPSRRGYFRRRQLKWFETGQELIYRRVLPYVKYLILNRDELVDLEPSVELKGLELVMRQVARDMNHGRKEFPVEGGRVLVSDGKRGARYAELLDRDVGRHYWKKYGQVGGETFDFAERVLSTGDDNVVRLTSTLGAGDTFAGVFIGLTALGWDVGHAIRAATLGAQFYIANRQEPMISDLIDTEDEHTLSGTFGNFRDMVTFHLPGHGVETPYGTIVDKVVTIRTTQIHYPFWEIVARYAAS
jgi:hypothetical protein